MARSGGYYWVKLKSEDAVRVAEWSELCEKWFITGVDCSLTEDEVDPVSQKLRHRKS
jgi:hypothetical protein